MRLAMTNAASNELIKFLSQVARRLGVAEHVYVVGGAVRNFVMGVPVKDVDVTIDTVALKGKDSEWFARELMKVIPTSVTLTTNNYGVALMHVNGDWFLADSNLKGEDIEIANARKESYGGDGGKGYKPHMVEPATIEEDVYRREFNVNTLLWRLHDLANGPDKAEILDLTGCGLRDLQEGSLRCPRDPDVVFSDDPSRMVRAVKFLLKYGLKIAPEVKDSIRRNKDMLRNIPPSALANMLINTFLRDKTGPKALVELDKLGLLEVVADIARKDTLFRDTLGNWADREAKVDFVFVLMDLGLPSGKRLSFLDAKGVDRVREHTVNMTYAESDAYVQALRQPGKVMDMQKVMEKTGLSGAGVRMIQDNAREALLKDPSLMKGGLTEQVVALLGRSASVKTALNPLCDYSEHSYAWIDPQGKVHVCGPLTHTKWAVKYLEAQGRTFRPNFQYGAQEELFEAGWVRAPNGWAFSWRTPVTAAALRGAAGLVVKAWLSCPPGSRQDTISVETDDFRRMNTEDFVKKYGTRDMLDDLMFGKQAAVKMAGGNPCNPDSHSYGWIDPSGHMNVLEPGDWHSNWASEYLEARGWKSDPTVEDSGGEDIISEMLDRGFIHVSNAKTLRMGRPTSAAIRTAIKLLVDCALKNKGHAKWSLDSRLFLNERGITIGDFVEKYGRQDDMDDLMFGKQAARRVASRYIKSKQASACDPYGHSYGWIAPDGELFVLKKNESHEAWAAKFLKRPDIESASAELRREGWIRVGNPRSFHSDGNSPPAAWRSAARLLVECCLAKRLKGPWALDETILADFEGRYRALTIEDFVKKFGTRDMLDDLMFGR